MWSNGFAFAFVFCNNKTNKTTFETHWLLKYSSEKQGKRMLPTLYLDATVFSFKILIFKMLVTKFSFTSLYSMLCFAVLF